MQLLLSVNIETITFVDLIPIFSLLLEILVFAIIILFIWSLHKAGNNGKKIKELIQSNILVECPACHSKISIGSDKCPKCGKISVLFGLKKKQKITDIVIIIILLFSIAGGIIGVLIMVIMHLETPIVVIVPVVVFTLASLYYIIFGLVQASKLKKYLESLPVVKPDANTDNLEPISNSSTQQGSFCRSCGNQLNPGASFCPKCGTKV